MTRCLRCSAWPVVRSPDFGYDCGLHLAKPERDVMGAVRRAPNATAARAESAICTVAARRAAGCRPCAARRGFCAPGGDPQRAEDLDADHAPVPRLRGAGITGVSEARLRPG
jgi:hypothetical protein